MSEFDNIVHGEPGQKEKADAWQTAIGLQGMDELKVPVYLLDTARQHIEGDIFIDEARERIKVYYENKSGHDAVNEEGDKVSANIAKIIMEPCRAALNPIPRLLKRKWHQQSGNQNVHLDPR